MKRIFTLFLVLFAFLMVNAEKKTINLVSNAHFDTQWNWDVQTSISKFIPNTMRRNFFLLERYPDYIFNFEGAVKYSWMKEYYPREYELVKEWIKLGRWHISGASWDATDPNIPSPESLTRNILLGQKFYKDEFGVLSTDIFLPDCFGFGWTMPSIAAHCGLMGFSTQKLQWREKPFYGDRKSPFHIGIWQGIDGARIMAAPDAKNYTKNWNFSDLSQDRELKEVDKVRNTNEIFRYFGTGDQGGSGKISTVRTVEYAVNHPSKEFTFSSITSDGLFIDYLQSGRYKDLPVWDGELLMDVHGTGCYTSQAVMKLLNRRNEQMADKAERASIVAEVLGTAEYPSEIIEKAWKRFIWHQFHDDLTGTSIPRAYEFSWNDELLSLSQFSDVLTSSVAAASSKLDTRVRGKAVVVFSSSAHDRSDIVRVSSSRDYAVYDGEGRRVASQYNNGVLEFIAKVPAVGYAVYDLREGKSSTREAVRVTNNTLENSVYKLTLDKNGDIASIRDKRYGRELVEKGKAFRLAYWRDNHSYQWPAWEIIKDVIDRQPESISQNVKIEKIVSGPLRSALKVTRTLGKSTIVQIISLSEEANQDRILIENKVDWAEENTLLKAEFPMSVSNPQARYDLGLGSVLRGNNTPTAYEVFAQKWADITSVNGDYGITVMNDCKYGWDKPQDNVLRLTLLHTPGTQNRYRHQQTLDHGHHEFTYAIVGHKGDVLASSTLRSAEALNTPFEAFYAPKHKGEAGRKYSMMKVSNPSVMVSAFKKAEDGQGYIVRLYELSGKEQTSSIRFGLPVASFEEVNGLEEPYKEPLFGFSQVKNAKSSYEGNTASVTVPGFSVRSFRVKFLNQPKVEKAAMQSILMAESKLLVKKGESFLKTTKQSSSYDSFAMDVDFDGKGCSMASELIPQSLTYDGIDFNLVNPEQSNAMAFRGNTIKVAEGGWKYLHMLVASTDYDKKIPVWVDGEKIELEIPLYDGKFGQWGWTGHSTSFVRRAKAAYVGTHKHLREENADIPYEFTYMYMVTLPLKEGAREIVLPKDVRTYMFAATYSMDDRSQVTPCSDLMRVAIPYSEFKEWTPKVNILKHSMLVESSGRASKGQDESKLVDELEDTKWCDADLNTDKFVVYDLGESRKISGYEILHAGLEAKRYISRDFSIQVRNSDSEEWTTVDSVKDNLENETSRKFGKPVEARFIRLLITIGEQSGGKKARIYEFRVF